MVQTGSTGKARCAARCGASGKRRNVAGGPIRPTEGRVFRPPGQRCTSFMMLDITALGWHRTTAGFWLGYSGLPARAPSGETCRTSSANGRQHRGAGSSSGRRRKRGTQRHGFGRSKGGFTTKIHLIANAWGLPMRAEITGGEVSDYKGFDVLMDGDLTAPKVFIADKGYDSDAVRQTVAERAGSTVISTRSNRKEQIPLDHFIHALRNQIERCFNKLKCARRPGNQI